MFHLAYVQLQKAAKLRIATYLQNWYRSRKCFLAFQSMRESAMVIQRAERRRQGHPDSCATPIVQGGSETILAGHVAPKEESPSDHDDYAIRVNLFSPDVDSPVSTTFSPPAVSPEVRSREFTFSEVSDDQPIAEAGTRSMRIIAVVIAFLVCILGTVFSQEEMVQQSCHLLSYCFPQMKHCPLQTQPVIHHPHYHSQHRHEALSRVRNRNDKVSHNHKTWHDRHDEKHLSASETTKNFVTMMEESMMELSNTVVHEGETFMASMDDSLREISNSVQDWMKPTAVPSESSSHSHSDNSLKKTTETDPETNARKVGLSPLAEWQWIANHFQNN